MPPFARIYDRRTESGQALVIVLIVALLLITTLVAALASARAGLAQSNGYTAEAQGEMAAQTGLATEITAMRNASTYGALPCDLTGALGVTGATSSYAVVVTYSAAGTQLACPPTVGTTLGGITAPTNATLTASGKAPHGITAVMREDLGIVVNSSTSAALGYAIFTENSVNLVDAATLQTGTATPDIYAGGQVTCASRTASTGNLVTQYAQGIVLSGTCSFGGNLTSAGPVNMQGSALVTGNVISYGGNTAGTSCSGGSPYYSICLSGNPLIVGNATETNGSIEVPNGRIAGNAYATGTISITNGGTLGGTKNPNDSALSSQTMPAVIAFPAITLPSTGWNIVSIPNSSYTCATYFANIDNEDSGSRVVFPDPFQSASRIRTRGLSTRRRRAGRRQVPSPTRTRRCSHSTPLLRATPSSRSGRCRSRAPTPSARSRVPTPTCARLRGPPAPISRSLRASLRRAAPRLLTQASAAMSTSSRTSPPWCTRREK